MRTIRDRGFLHCGRPHSLITKHENSVAFIALKFYPLLYNTFLVSFRGHQTFFVEGRIAARLAAMGRVQIEN